MNSPKEPYRNLNNAEVEDPFDDLDTFLRRPIQEAAESGTYKACLSCCGKLQMCCSWFCAACDCGPLIKIRQGEVGLKLVYGKYECRLKPGLYAYNPCIEEIIKIDMRSQIIDVGNQQLLTKDNVTLTVDAFVNFRVMDAALASFKVFDYRQMIMYLTQGTMKTIIAEHTLSELLSNRKSIEKKITEIIEEKTNPYGIRVDLIETQRVMLPQAMERAMATVAETTKQAEARVIDAKGNLESAKIFKEAADELSKNTISIQLQYFETLKYIAAEKNSTIIVPDSVLSLLRK